MARFLHYIIAALVAALVVELLVLSKMPEVIAVPKVIETPVPFRERYLVTVPGPAAPCPAATRPVTAARPAKPKPKREEKLEFDEICLADPICGLKRQAP